MESPGGDDTRTWMPPVRDGVSTYYLAVNRNKRSMALDLREHAERAAAQELAARADIVVENFKPGGLARFGLDYESVSGRNPAVRGQSALGGVVRARQPGKRVVAGGMVPYRMGNAHPSLFPYEPLPAADGEIIAGNDGQFRTLCDVLGVPELAGDDRFVRNKDRTANRDQLRPLLIERLARRTAMQWFRDLTAAGVACGAINTVDGGVSFARLLGLDPVVTAGQGARAMPGIRNPIGLSATPARYRLPPPELDEHGNQIRRWLAGPRRPASGLDL